MNGSGNGEDAAAKNGRTCNGTKASVRVPKLAWCLVVLLPPILCFVVSSIFLARWERQLEEANRSIAENGGPSVVELSAEQAYLRRMEARALMAAPESLHDDRAKIGALRTDLQRANDRYRETEDYPGELEAYLRVLEARTRFYAAVDHLLTRIEDGVAHDREARSAVAESANVLSTSLATLVRINSDQIVSANAAARAVRRRAIWLTAGRDALAFSFVLAGTLLGLRSARREAALAAERRRLDLQRADDLDDFAGRVAHDLRDALSSILFRAEMAEKAETLEASRKHAGQVAAASRRMSGIITTLLEFARAGGQATPGSRCEPGPVVRQVVADVQPLAAEAGAEILVEPMREAAVACDATVLSVVFANLVRNAVKYIGEGRGGVRRITLREREEEDACLRFEVEDTGPGLPPGAEEQVFTPFVRLPGTSSKPGIGLGLATVRRLVEAHGGEVGVTSPPGAGACFWFTFPVSP